MKWSMFVHSSCLHCVANI